MQSDIQSQRSQSQRSQSQRSQSQRSQSQMPGSQAPHTSNPKPGTMKAAVYKEKWHHNSGTPAGSCAGGSAGCHHKGNPYHHLFQ